MAYEIPSGDDLKRWRASLGLTQAEVARRAGVSQPLIARIERGTVDPRASTLRSVLRALSTAERADVRVREVMTAPIVAARATDSLLKAVEIMRENDFSQLPVVSKGAPVGSLSERAILQRLHEAKDPKELALVPVESIMGPAFPAVDADEPLDAAYGMLEQHPALLVMERGRPVGLVTKADVLKLLGKGRGGG